MFCHKCGTKSLADAVFCQKCGAKLVADKATTAQRPPAKTTPQTVTAPIQKAVLKPDKPKASQTEATPVQIVTPKPTKLPPPDDPPVQKPLPDKKKLLSLIKYSWGLSILRFVDALAWIAIILFQITDGAGVGTIIWNIAATAITIVLAVKLLPGKYSEQYKEYGQYNQKGIATNVSNNIGVSVLALILYGVQLAVFENNVMIPLLILETAVIIVGILALCNVDKSVFKPALRESEEPVESTAIGNAKPSDDAKNSPTAKQQRLAVILLLVIGIAGILLGIFVLAYGAEYYDDAALGFGLLLTVGGVFLLVLAFIIRAISKKQQNNRK